MSFLDAELCNLNYGLLHVDTEMDKVKYSVAAQTDMETASAAALGRLISKCLVVVDDYFPV